MSEVSEIKMDDSFVTFLSQDSKYFESSEDLVTFGISKESVHNYQFDDGSVYTGKIANGLRHGRGINIWKDGSMYDGHWYKNQRKGIGKY